MRIAELTTWVAAGLAIIGVTLAAWQLRKAHHRAQLTQQHASRAQVLLEETEKQAARAEHEARQASSQARWAWEQVKLASTQLEQAQSEHRASSDAEHWEWSYALTTSAREAVDASSELIRIALDSHVAPHYRLAAERHYDQTTTRWQETMTKALARTEPTLELQHQVLTFTRVQHRLHGYIGVLLRAAETGTLSTNDQLSQQVVASGQELENVRRQLQRTVNDSLVGAHLDSADTALHDRTANRALESGPLTELSRQSPDTSYPHAHGSLGPAGPAPDQRSGSRRDPARRSTAPASPNQPGTAPVADPPNGATATRMVAPQTAGRLPATPPPLPREQSRRLPR